MIKKISKTNEFENFSKLSQEWWNPEGKFKVIHRILPLRINYILNNIDQTKIKNFDILDLGCGGGLTCEPLSRVGAKVTGIDFIKKNIEIAKNHAKKENLNIQYLHQDLHKIKLKKKYDVILLLEVLEHLDFWENIFILVGHYFTSCTVFLN